MLRKKPAKVKKRRNIPWCKYRITLKQNVYRTDLKFVNEFLKSHNTDFSCAPR